MTRGGWLFAALAGTVGFGVAGIATSQDKATGTPEAVKTLPSAKVEDFKPGFDDLMTMLVQPRHLKLQYAGASRNWELASAESRNLRQALGSISHTLPEYLGIDVAEAIDAMMRPQLQAVDAGIAAADPAKFASAYDGLTKACNACHAYMERPYIVVKVPDTSAPLAYPGQDFKPAL